VQLGAALILPDRDKDGDREHRHDRNDDD